MWTRVRNDGIAPWTPNHFCPLFYRALQSQPTSQSARASTQPASASHPTSVSFQPISSSQPARASTQPASASHPTSVSSQPISSSQPARASTQPASASQPTNISSQLV